MTLTPCSLRLLMRSSTLPTSLTASAAVGSSIMTTPASKAVARPMATAFCLPPGSSPAGAVVDDDGEHLAALQLQANGIERGDRAEILRYPLCFEERSAGMVNRRRFHGAPLPWFA